MHTFVAIDLKSFYASVECAERELDPLSTNLVVADPSRTEKTICLAVSPALKRYGIPGRARLFEVVEKVTAQNALRREKAPGKRFTGKSVDADELADHPELEIDYIVAPPRMAHYMAYSTKVYEIYMKYVAPEDIHVYSVDEVFIDVTQYLKTYGKTPRELALTMIRDVLSTTGVTATAGIGTNMFLAKIAMDIVAKKMPPDKDGVRIAELDEISFRRQLWDRRPLTDFWRIGRGTAKRLERHGLMTLGDVARFSLTNEDDLYRMFGINAELLIDHAWGQETTLISDIHAYKPENNSISSGQVLTCPYSYEKAALVMREMAENLSLDLVEKQLITEQISISIGYDIECLTNPEIAENYKGPVVTDAYGRRTPKGTGGMMHLHRKTSSSRLIVAAAASLFEQVADPHLLIRRMVITALDVTDERRYVPLYERTQQLELFTDWEALEKQQREEETIARKERAVQQAVLDMKKRFGKNAVLRGMNLEEGATAKERNSQIGGHKA